MGKLPKFEDWKAPWEVKGEELDPDKVKRYLYNLERDKETLTTEKAQATQKVTELQSKVDEHESKDLTEVQRLQREIEQLKQNPPKDEGTVLENARLRLALEHGLTVDQAKRLQGSTPEELEADVDALKAIIGQTGKEKEREAPGGRFRTGNESNTPPDDDNPEQFDKLWA